MAIVSILLNIKKHFVEFWKIQFSPVTQLCLTLCNPMNRSTPDLPVRHQLLESTQTHVHWVGDAIQPSHPLSSPSPALNLSQHQGLFKWGSFLKSSFHLTMNVTKTQCLSLSFVQYKSECYLIVEIMLLLVPWEMIKKYYFSFHYTYIVQCIFSCFCCKCWFFS